MPINDISATIFYNQRLIISAPIPEPIAWRVTKVEDVSPKGVRRITFAQDIWDQHSDYIEKDENGFVIGMYADYFKSAVTPEEGIQEDTSLFSSITSKITTSGNSTQIRVGGQKTFTATFYEDDNPVEHAAGEWSFSIDGEDISDLLTISYLADNKVRIKFIGDDNYIGKIITVTYTSEDIMSSMDIGIVAL